MNENTPVASKPLNKTVRRAIIGSTVAVVAGAGAVATFAGAAFAADAPSTDSASPATSSSASATPGSADASAPVGKGGPRGGGMGKGGPGGAIKETSVVKAADGTISTELRVDGTVTAVSATSITIKGADNSTTTYAIPSTVTVPTTVKVGATVDAHGTVSGTTNTLKNVHVDGEKPTAPAAGATTPTERPTRLHSTAIVADKDNTGKYITRVQQTGTITAVSATSITVKSDDNYSATYTLATGVTTTAKVGDKVGIAGTQAGTTNTAERIATGDQLTQQGPGGKGGPRGGGMGPRGEAGQAAGDAAAPADAATGDAVAPAASTTAPASTTQNGANLPATSSLV